MSERKAKQKHSLHEVDEVPWIHQIFTALHMQKYVQEEKVTFVRAVINRGHVATASPFKPGRFGPAPNSAGIDLRLPFTWLYVATDSLVAAWESRFLLNNFGAGAGFHITRLAETHGMLAYIRFRRPLRLWNLCDDHSSRLGFQAAISSAEHATCHLFGERLRGAMLMMPTAQRPDGFIYPSHRVKGHSALALADWATSDLFSAATLNFEAFVESEIYEHYRHDPMRTAPPLLDA